MAVAAHMTLNNQQSIHQTTNPLEKIAPDTTYTNKTTTCSIISSDAYFAVNIVQGDSGREDKTLNINS